MNQICRRSDGVIMKNGSVTKRLTVCALSTALGIVLMLIGGLIGVGTYAVPLLIGILFSPIGRIYGVRWQLSVVCAVGLLGLVLIADAEQALCFLAFFGWYPALRSSIEKLPCLVAWCLKFLIFNIAMAAVETLAFLVFSLPFEGIMWMAIFLLAFNLVFIIYDLALPKIQTIFCSQIERLL